MKNFVTAVPRADPKTRGPYRGGDDVRGNGGEGLITPWRVLGRAGER